MIPAAFAAAVSPSISAPASVAPFPDPTGTDGAAPSPAVGEDDDDDPAVRLDIVLMPFAGAPTLAGGAGNDVYDNIGTGLIVENFNEGTDTVRIANTYTLTDKADARDTRRRHRGVHPIRDVAAWVFGRQRRRQQHRLAA
mgnify:CR=1 FL=1